jgi:hypothetical protein
MDNGGDEVGSYSLSLQRTFNPPNATPIAYDTSLTASLSLVTEMDAYTFFGNFGDSVTIQMTRTSGSLNPRIELYNSQGILINSTWNYTSAILGPVILPSSGIYTILCMDEGGDHTGDYQLSLQGIPATYGPKTIVTFNVITNHIVPALAPEDSIGLRGDIAPLDLNSSLRMTNTDGDSIYEITVEFDSISTGQTLSYKFVVDRADGSTQWEGFVNPQNPPYGNRTLLLSGGLIDLPPVYFDNAGPADLDSGLVAYYPFNGNANDESGNGNDATVSGATLTTDRFDIPNLAFGFDGNDYINTNLIPSNIFTLSLWYYAEPTQLNNAGLASTYSSTNYSGFYYGTNGTTEWIRYDNNAIQTTSGTNSQWTHLVIVSNGGYIKVYKEGTPVLNFQGTTTHSDVLLFGDSRFNSRYFTGKIDDVRLYNRAITAEEVQTIFQTESVPPDSMPVATDDRVTTLQNTPITIEVLANDVHTTGLPIFLTNVSQPSYGTAVIDPGDTTITYTPDPDFNRVDFFNYIVSDANGQTDTALVTVTVIPVIDTTKTLVYNNDFEGSVGSEWSNTTTDITPAGARRFLGQFGNQTVGLTLNNLPLHRKVTVYFDLFIIQSWDGNASSIYGPDIWDLSVSSGQTLLHTTFRNTDGGMQAYPGSYPGGNFPPRTGTAENNTLGYSLFGDAVYKLSYTFPHTSSSLLLDFSGSGLQELADESWGLDNIEVRVAEVDTIPVAVNDTITTLQNTPITVHLLNNDYHTAGFPFTLTGFSQPSNGATVLDPGDITVTYSPSPGYSGTDEFSYVITDSSGITDSALVLISVVPPLPDLQVTQVQAPPQAFSGQTVQVNWIVTNIGLSGTDVPEWFDRLYLSPVPNFDPQQATTLGTFENLAYLSPGEGYSNTATLTLPRGIEGDYYIFVKADYDNRLTEPDENNNLSRNDSAMQITLTPPPDLQIINAIAPTNAFSGDQITVEWTVKNLGSGTTEIDRWFDTVFLSEDSTLDFFFPISPPNTIVFTDPQKAKVEHIGALAPGDSFTTSVTFNLPPYVFGTYSVFIHADMNPPVPGGKAQERGDVYEHVFDFNNIHRHDIDITLTPPPDLIVETVSSIADTASNRESISVTWTVKNAGLSAPDANTWQDRVYLSGEPVFNPDSVIAVGTFTHSGALEPDSSYTMLKNVTIPGNISGPYYVFVKTDWNDQVFDLNTFLKITISWDLQQR